MQIKLNRIIKSLKEALAYARGEPEEGTRRTTVYRKRGEWVTEEFRDGVWRIISTRPDM